MAFRFGAVDYLRAVRTMCGDLESEGMYLRVFLKKRCPVNQGCDPDSYGSLHLLEIFATRIRIRMIQIRNPAIDDRFYPPQKLEIF
jgi:hypothetical protein